jgi:hypothetical protein
MKTGAAGHGCKKLTILIRAVKASAVFIILPLLFTGSFLGKTPCSLFADTFTPALYKTKAPDGWTIALKRFKKPESSGEKLPVVLCHGFNHNDRLWYLDKEYSLAYYLYERGYDVWLLSLRGSGESTKPGISELRSLSRLHLLKMPETLVASSHSKTSWSLQLVWNQRKYKVS